MEKIRSFTGLIAWQQAHKLTLAIYAVTKDFPSDEKFGLTSQLRRAAVSVSSNIAEGFRRRTKKDKQRFYEIAQASLTETQNELLISRDIQYLTPETFQKIAEQTVFTGKLITGLTRSAINHPR